MIRLLIADDHPIVRMGLQRIVAEESDIMVVGEAGSGEETLQRCRELRPDVLLLDISMPGPGFLETLRELREHCPRTRVLVLSVHPEDQYALRALKAGASGYLTKDHSPERLTAAVRTVHAGERYLTPALEAALAGGAKSADGEPSHEDLSEREYQVFHMLITGRSVMEISETLQLSPKTVSTYRSRVLQKMGLKTNADLVRYGVRSGLVD